MRSNRFDLAELIESAKALVFDFDGTLVDSNPIKRRAFERCFEEFPAHRDQILSYCWGNHHTPRGDKFRFVYEKILRLPYTPSEEARLHQIFESETTRQIAKAPSVVGVEAFLATVRRSHLTALLSSTPDPVLLEILTERRWVDYFHLIHGAPVDKAEWLSALRRGNHWSRRQMIFFGDTLEDADSALEADCLFVGVAHPEFEERGHLFLKDFAQLPLATRAALP